MQPPAILQTEAWFRLVNHRPDQAPHLVVVGPTGSGKTTLVTGLLHDRPGQVVILTPKPDDAWGSLPFITIDDDGSFTTAAQVFSALLVEVKRRLVASKRKHDPGPPLNVVIDDFPALRDVCPDADTMFLLVARLGRSLRVRLIILSYSGQVKELGLEGRGESREHFLWLRLDRQRRASLTWDDTAHQLDSSLVVALAQRPLDADRVWVVPPAPTTASEREIGTPSPPTPTTPPAMVGAAQAGNAGVVVVGKASIVEQVAILREALKVQIETGEISRSEVCRRVFDGATGGTAYNKTKAVLDVAAL